MNRTHFAILLISMIPFVGQAQSQPRVTSGIDVGLGYEDKAWAPSAMYHQELSLNHFPWFRIGWGVRANGFYNGRTDLAPKSTAQSGDTLRFGKITTNSFSFLAGTNIRIWKFDIGANTDLFGIAFGVKRRGLYAKPSFTEGEGAPFYNSYVSSSPTPLNALPLLLENNNGQSELFVRFWVTDRIGLKVGYVHGRVTYTASERLDNGQRRFSKSYGLPYAALSFPLYN